MNQRLNDSLDADPEIEEAWVAEVERREVEIEWSAAFIARSRDLSQAESGVSMKDEQCSIS
jgi:hypothetical protein